MKPIYNSFSIEDDDCFLTPYLAIYDSLNDDDEDIRNVGAKIVSTILEAELAPLPAQTEFIRFLNQYFCHSPLWTWNNVCRITGNNSQIFEKEPASLDQPKDIFRTASTRDDSLFAEEKQNLFVDEVREVRQWTAAFENVAVERSRCCQTDSKGKPLKKENRQSLAESALATWTLEGLEHMTELVKVEDGPLGYVSNPVIFTACMRVILAANALIKLQKTLPGRARSNSVIEDIKNRLFKLLCCANKMNVHPMILSSIKENSALIWGKLRPVARDAAKKSPGQANIA